MIKHIFLPSLLLFFNACNLGESEEEIMAKKRQQKKAFQAKLLIDESSEEVELIEEKK